MNRTMNMVSMLAFAGVVALSPAANAITVLDTFLGPQTSAFIAGPATSTFTATTADILGGTRTMTVGRVAGVGEVTAKIAATGNTLVYSSDFNTDGFLTLGYNTPAFDITPGANGLTGQLAGDLGGASFTLTIGSTGGNSSSATQVIIPSGTSGTFSNFSIPFASLVGNVNLMQVTSVTLRLDGANSFDGALRLLQFSTPPTGVPEPGSVALAFGMLGGAAFTLRRRARK